MKILDYFAGVAKNLGRGKKTEKNPQGTKRLYWKGVVNRYGFTPGSRYDAELKGDCLTISLNPNGKRIVSHREEAGKDLPVIDIENDALLQPFEGQQQVRIIYATGKIHVLLLATVAKIKERLQRTRQNMAQGFMKTAAICCGIGVMSLAMHEGFAEAGVNTKTEYAVELRPELLRFAKRNNQTFRHTVLISAPLQEVVNDDWLMSNLERTDGMVISIPCSAASKAGAVKTKEKKGKTKSDQAFVPEEHEHVGHLISATMAAIRKFSPTWLVFENVPPYAQTASGYILRNELKDLGYEVHEMMLKGSDYNVFEHRDRWVVVAVTAGIPFDLSFLEKPEPESHILDEILETIPLTDPRWSRMDGLKAHCAKHKAMGNGFSMQVFNRHSDHIGTLTKGYARVRPTDPKIGPTLEELTQPGDEELLRQLTAAEHARCKGIPESLIDGMSSTLAHEVLGQSVLYQPFVAVGKLIGNFMQDWFDSKGEENSTFTLAKAAA